MSTYAERKVAWAAHHLHRHQASIWAAERARIFREEEIERLAQEQMEEDRIKSEERLNCSVQRNYLKERARKLYKQGYTMKQIAEKLSVSYQRARSWVIDLSRGNRGRAYLSPEVEETKRLRDQGLTYREIGEIMGVNLETARSRYLRHPDVKP